MEEKRTKTLENKCNSPMHDDVKRRMRVCWLEAETRSRLRLLEELRKILFNPKQSSEMKFLNANAEKNFRRLAEANSDAYGVNIIRMANDLACLLQAEIEANGKITEALVKECEKIIFVELYNAPESQAKIVEDIISQHWIYGNEFYPFTRRVRKERTE